MKYSNAAVQQNDARLVSRTLLKLATPRIIMRAAVIIVTIIVWLWVAARILEFGAVQDYAFLDKFNAQLVSFLHSINPYLWWAVVLLGTLIVYFFLSAWYSGSVQRAAYKTVPADTAADLIKSLSPEGRDVLGWVWRDRSEPINIGNLKTTKDELDNNRVSKLAQIRDQERLLGPGTLVAADDRLAAPLTANRPVASVERDMLNETNSATAQPRPVAVDAPAQARQPEAVAAKPVVAPEPVVSPPVVKKAAPAQPDDTPPTVRDEPVIQDVADQGEAKERPAVSSSEQTEPTIGRSDDTHLRPPRDEVKHTIT
ncbi:membrane protein [Advenella kashmirensis W13003]|uniref:Membrane protein n=1 Tax=Advenella kashmirensis W13003 TaxID=1424334 RepID=V8QT88_9BURK|nr:membrane protein [Advenella kashmirensis]ETF02862.1 membrane protein [Advenella kashmirensis W13003]